MLHPLFVAALEKLLRTATALVGPVVASSGAPGLPSERSGISSSKRYGRDAAAKFQKFFDHAGVVETPLQSGQARNFP